MNVSEEHKLAHLAKWFSVCLILSQMNSMGVSKVKEM